MNDLTQLQKEYDDLKVKYDELENRHWRTIHAIRGNLNGMVISRLEEILSCTISDNLRSYLEPILHGANVLYDSTRAEFFKVMGSEDHFKEDITNPEEGSNLQLLLGRSLWQGVQKMSDPYYFYNYRKAYFPTEDLWKASRQDWHVIFKDFKYEDIEPLKVFMKNHMKIEVISSIESSLIVGAKHYSAQRLYLILEELVTNALLALSYSQTNRLFHIEVASDEKELSIIIRNSCAEHYVTHGTGFGTGLVQQLTTIVGGTFSRQNLDGIVISEVHIPI